MKTVPLNDKSGSIPLRASANPVMGVFRHHCGEIASVHQPKGGKRSHTRYLICDRCGTDQCGGKAYQAEIKAKTYPSIEALQTAENAVSTVNETPENDADNTSDNLTEKVGDVKPIETAPHAVSTVKEPCEIIDPVLTEDSTSSTPLIKPVQAAPNAVSTVNSVPPQLEPKQNEQAKVSSNTPVNTPKPMRVGIFAVVGGVVGALLAAVA